MADTPDASRDATDHAQELDGKPSLRFADERVRHVFRQELREVRFELIKCKKALSELAEIEDTSRDPGKSGRPICNRNPRTNRYPHNADGGPLASLEEINRKERESVTVRRKIFRKSNTKYSGLTSDPDDAPQGEVHNAIGLALSGGGIRSATFCSRIVQYLVLKRLFSQFDYLSMVSGGGYFGGFLSCSLGSLLKGGHCAATKEAALARIDAIFGSHSTQAQRASGQVVEVETGLLRHLRNNSQYLLSGGLLGKLKIAGLLSSGIFYNVLMAITVSLALALGFFAVDGFCYSDRSLPLLSGVSGWLISDVLIYLAAGLGLFVIVLPLVQKVTHGKAPGESGFRNFWELATLYLGVGAALVGLVCLAPALFHGYECLRVAFVGMSPGGPT